MEQQQNKRKTLLIVGGILAILGAISSLVSLFVMRASMDLIADALYDMYSGAGMPLSTIDGIIDTIVAATMVSCIIGFIVLLIGGIMFLTKYAKIYEDDKFKAKQTGLIVWCVVFILMGGLIPAILGFVALSVKNTTPAAVNGGATDGIGNAVGPSTLEKRLLEVNALEKDGKLTATEAKKMRENILSGS